MFEMQSECHRAIYWNLTSWIPLDRGEETESEDSVGVKTCLNSDLQRTETQSLSNSQNIKTNGTEVDQPDPASQRAAQRQGQRHSQTPGGPTRSTASFCACSHVRLPNAESIISHKISPKTVRAAFEIKPGMTSQRCAQQQRANLIRTAGGTRKEEMGSGSQKGMLRGSV